MPDVRPPTQLRLVLSRFPPEPWARDLVDALNKFGIEVVEAINIASIDYKLVRLATGPVVADLFPLDLPVGFQPREVRVAQVLEGVPTAGVVPAVLWQPLSDGKTIRVTLITGLEPSSAYLLRLAID